MIRRQPFFLLALALAVVQSSFAIAAEAPRDVLSHASESRYWVLQVFPPDARAKTTRSAIRVREAQSDAWQRVGVLQGRAVGLAHFGANAAVMLDDQSWLLAWPGGTSRGPALGDGFVLQAIASDSNSLWALGAGREGVEASPQLRLYEYEAGQWKPYPAPPKQIPADAEHSLAVFDGHPMLAAKVAEQRIVFARMNRDGEWSDVESIPTNFNIADFQLLSRTPTPAIWLAPTGSPGEMRFRKERWSDPVALRETALPKDASQRTIKFFAGSLRMLALAEGQNESKLLEQAFTLEGAPVAGVIELGKTPPPPAPPVNMWSLLAIALLSLLLSSAIFRNEDEEKLAEQKQRLASLPKRLLAGLIDLAPMVLIVGWTLPWRESTNWQQAFEEDSMLWRAVIAVSVYLLHTTILEMLIGRSLGKLACRLRVVDLDGNPPKKSAILIRNIARVIDILPGLPLALLILFSPLRQRVGDVMAKTIVIQDAAKAEETGTGE